MSVFGQAQNSSAGMTRSRTFKAVWSSQVAKATSGQARVGMSGAVDDVLGSVLEPGRKGSRSGVMKRDEEPM